MQEVASGEEEEAAGGWLQAAATPLEDCQRVPERVMASGGSELGLLKATEPAVLGGFRLCVEDT